MATIHQIRGALLEEAVLALLRASGYRTVTTEIGDDCLARHPAGIGVCGRACIHQIDAIADHIIAHPFSHPQRLLVEAKNFNDRRAVGVEVIRNAVGVLKDVGEFVPPHARIPYRHHYQYAVFASSRFSPDAQHYAFAHDVYLLQLSATSGMAAILSAIEDYAATLDIDRRGRVAGVDLPVLRGQLRRSLQPELPGGQAEAGRYPVEGVVEAVESVGGSVVAVIARALPIFLTPADPGLLDRIPSRADVELFIDHGNQREWRIAHGADTWFYFEVPTELFDSYQSAGTFDPVRAVGVKAEYFREIQFVLTRGARTRLITLRLNPEWLERAQASVRNQT